MNINSAFKEESVTDRICDAYQETIGESDDDHFQILHEPFKVLKLKNLCDNPEFVEKLAKQTKDLDFHRKSNDLYGLWQSDDLTHSDNPLISTFATTLRNDVGVVLSKIMKVTFNEHFTLTASLYGTGDVLLCHDDKCADRCVAFVYYLTGTGKEEGGAFEMFAKNDEGQPSAIVKSLPPVANSLLCFEVGNFTYHQVSEVLDPTFERLSLNGWFHSDRKLDRLDYLDPMPSLSSQVFDLGDVFFDEFVNPLYTAAGTLEQAQKNFEVESQILFQDFLRKDLYTLCGEELKRMTEWTTRGPANRRRYDVTNVLDSNVKKLVAFLGSPPFFSYLSELTGLSLAPRGEVEDEPSESSQYVMEVQRWEPGSYTMATDNDEFFRKSGLDLYLWFNSSLINLTPDGGGTVNYLAADDDESEDEDDKELLNIDPVDNALVLVYRTEDTVKFTKYHNHSLAGSYHCIAATYYEAASANELSD